MVVWVASGTQVQPQIILDPDYLQTIFPFLMTMVLYNGSSFFKYLINNRASPALQIRFILGLAFPSFTDCHRGFFTGIFDLIESSALLVSPSSTLSLLSLRISRFSL